MKKNMRKILSLLLSIVITFQIIPQQVYALVLESTKEIQENSQNIDEYSGSKAFVEGEIEDLRTETEKHYKLSDGTFYSVSYFEPVHYVDSEGKWQDIDNTLFIDEEKKLYSTKQNGKSKVQFSTDLSDGELASLSWGDYLVSMSLLNASEIEEYLSEAELGNDPDYFELLRSFHTEYNPGSTIEIQDYETAPKDKAENEYNSGELIPKTLSSKVSYSEAYEGVDIEYTLKGYDLKEWIVLREKLENYVFSFLLTLEGLTAKMQEDGSVILSDNKGDTIYYIPTPFMVDAKGEVSFDAYYYLIETSEGVVLSIVADKDWIESKDREFPVMIDPTLLAKTDIWRMNQESDIYATFITQGQPNEVHANNPAMFIGHGRGTEAPMLESWGVYHFHNLPTIPDSCDVVGASFCIYLPTTAGQWLGYSAFNCPTMPLEMREVNFSENANYYSLINSLTWNNMPSLKEDVIDYLISSAAQEDSYISWDMTGLTKKWYSEGTNNRTVAIKPTARGNYYSDSHFAQIQFFFYIYPPYEYYYRPPYYAVAYRNTDGIEAYYTYNSLSVGRAGTAYIQDNTGQLKVVNNIVSYASTINPVSLSLVYNSDHFKNSSNAYLPYGPTMDFGSGWTIDSIEKLTTQTISDVQYLKYMDGDGTQHFFAKKSGDNTYYYDEDGLGLKIKAVSGGYEMSDDKDTKWTFTDGYLRSRQDANGNKVIYEYIDGRLRHVKQQNNGASLITVASLIYDGNTLSSITDAAGRVFSFNIDDDGLLECINLGDTLLASYEYSGKRVATITDEESGYSLNFGYTDGRLDSYRESAGSEDGFKASIAYPNESKTTYQSHGNDRIVNTQDDIYTSYLFDYTGRTVNAYTTDADGKLIGASNAVYTKNDSVDKRNNRTLKTASMGEGGNNLLSDDENDLTDFSEWTFASGSNVTSDGISLSDEEYRSNSQSLKIRGSWYRDLHAYKEVTFDENVFGTTTYMLSGWAKGNSVPNTNQNSEDKDTDSFKQFGLRATIYYQDNTTEKHFAAFCPDLKSWQFTSLAIVPKEPTKKILKIRVEAVYEKNANTVYFDDISLIEEVAQTMEYDENGKLVSVSATGLNKETNIYNSGNLISAVTGGYGKYKYEYDNKHNLTSIKDDQENISQSISYTDQGNAYYTELKDSSNCLKLKSSADYDLNGNRLASETDSNGNSVTYEYSGSLSEMYGLPTKIESEDNRMTEYVYDDFGRTCSISAKNGSGTLSSLNYTYSDGNLTRIDRNAEDITQRYSLSYDLFGNVETIEVGNKLLTEYEYETGNGNLKKRYYGTYDESSQEDDLRYHIEYTYDDRSRLTLLEDSEGNRREYEYDQRNRPSLITGNDGTLYEYHYDGLDRITGIDIRENNIQLLSISNSYNASSQITQKTWTLGNDLYTQNYTYDTDPDNNVLNGLLTSMETGVGNPILFTYDALGRLTTSGAGSSITKAYSYRDRDEGYTTTQVEDYTASYGNAELFTGSYAYDSKGNVSTETSNDLVLNYFYDDLNQLIRVSDEDDDMLYTYAYDNAGNILSKTVGNESHTYGYDDSDWKDLLTSYDGEEIEYDNDDGNPTSYFNGRRFTFTWERGRNLVEAVNEEENIGTDLDFSYDFDGIRTGKTVRTYHVHVYEDPVVIPPTCTEDGYTEKTCICGDSIHIDPVPATGHSFEVTSTAAPTCTEEGYSVYTCSECGNEYIGDIVPSLGHDYQASAVLPTCEQEGYTLHTCTRCADSYMSDNVPALGHDYIDTVVPPSHDYEGYTLHTCSRCGDTYMSDPVPAAGHSFEVTSTSAPTCTEDGYSIYTCSECGNEYIGDIVPSLGHDYQEGVVSPTCEQRGYTLHTCSRCNDNYRTNYTQALGHNYIITEFPPEGDSEGYILNTCSRCGDEYISDYVPYSQHDFTSTFISPTCTEEGYTEHVCSTCGYTLRTDYEPAFGHTWDSVGLHRRCIVCGYTEGDIIIPPPGGGELYSAGSHLGMQAEPLEIQEEDELLQGLGESVTYEYIYSGDKLLQETVTEGNTTEVHQFFYDQNGSPYALKVDNAVYYYIINLQGDVVGLIDESGNIQASYAYDPYGKVLNATGPLADKNPLRYRGYYFDSESSLYYVSSRYYDPEICRFINADDVSNLGANNDIASLNLFAYCGNNPISRKDASGDSWVLATLGLMITGGVIGAVISTAISIYTQYTFTGSIDWNSVKVASFSGFVSGAIFASPLGVYGQMVAGGIIGAGSYLLDCFETKKEFNGFNFGASILSGIVCGYIGGAGANQGYLLSDIISGTVPHVLSSSTSNVSYCMIKTEYTASFMYSACTYIGNAFNSFIDYIVGLFE